MKNILTAKLTIFILIVTTMCTPKQESTDKTPFDQPPAWAKDAIWYQIFAERFNNGDTTNDPTPVDMYAASNYRQVPEGWSVTPWTWNWYQQEEWAKKLNTDFYGGLGLRRYGGDLQGVIDKLDYLQNLGVNAIYFNPLNDAPSLHKYDARNYRHIDVNFGPDPEGDKKIIALETPGDPLTWKWTAADKMFLHLIDEMHKRGMHVILDYSWNHTGVEFWAWKDLVEKQQKSEYKDWYAVTSFDDPETSKNEFEYKGWANLSSLPEIKKVAVEGERREGHPYEGDINEGAKKHIYAVTKRWLAPDGDISKGIDGFRLDVAEQIGLRFWRDWRKHVRSINPDAYLVGEIWWEKWPDALMDPTPYVEGDIFDAIMFYQVYRPARSFFGAMNDEIDAKQLKDSLEFQWNRLRPETVKAMMNTAATHDSPRLLTSFANATKYKFNAGPRANPDYLTGRPYPETYQRVRLYLIHQFTIPGAPHIWNGDEMGMWGADDPDCRKPLWWPEYDFEPEFRSNIQPGKKENDYPGFEREQFDFYKKLIRIRKENRELVDGDIHFLAAEGKRLAYSRTLGEKEIIVLFNLEIKQSEFGLPENEKYISLLDHARVSGKIILPPLSAAIIKKQSGRE